MKRLFLAASALALLIPAPAAFAQVQAVTGDVAVTGFVETKCIVTDGDGNKTGTTFSDTIAIGQLDDNATGLLKSSLQSPTLTAATTTFVKSFNIKCNGSDAHVDLSATQMSTGSGDPLTGYERRVNYTTDLVATLTTGDRLPFTYTTTLSGAPTVSGDLGGRLSSTLPNIKVKVYALATENSNTNMLMAGNYSGNIHIVITPKL